MRVRLSVIVKTLTVVLAILSGTIEELRAGVITGIAEIVGPGLGTAMVTVGVPPVAPNNDNAGVNNPNTIVISKRFDRVAPIDIVFNVSNSFGIPGTFTATTEYFISRDFVLNNTGVNWIDYHFELGFGTGNAFVRSNLADFIDFDTPDKDPTPTSQRFNTLNHQANTIDWANGGVPSGQFDIYTLSIDVFDSSNEIPSFARFATCNGYRLTLRQVPTVPEPSTWLMFGTGLMGLLGYAWRRRKSA